MTKTILTLLALTTVATVQANEFQPSMTTSSEVRAYGDVNDKGDNNRLEFKGNLQATEQLNFDYRIRRTTALDQDYKKEKNDIRLRANYQHNDNLTTRLQYQDNGVQSFKLQPRINMLNLFNVPQSNFISKGVFAPSVVHVQDDHRYYNQANLDFEFFGATPIIGLDWEVNLYYGNAKSQKADDYGFGLNADGTDIIDKQQQVGLELYLYHTMPLYKSDAFTLNLKSELGYEQYNNLKSTYDDELEKEPTKEINAYLETMVQLDKVINNNINVFVGTGFKYANFEDTTRVELNDFKFQPQVYAGFTTKF